MNNTKMIKKMASIYRLFIFMFFLGTFLLAKSTLGETATGKYLAPLKEFKIYSRDHFKMSNNRLAVNKGNELIIYDLDKFEISKKIEFSSMENDSLYFMESENKLYVELNPEYGSSKFFCWDYERNVLFKINLDQAYKEFKTSYFRLLSADDDYIYLATFHYNEINFLIKIEVSTGNIIKVTNGDILFNYISRLDNASFEAKIRNQNIRFIFNKDLNVTDKIQLQDNDFKDFEIRVISDNYLFLYDQTSKMCASYDRINERIAHKIECPEFSFKGINNSVLIITPNNTLIHWDPMSGQLLTPEVKLPVGSSLNNEHNEDGQIALILVSIKNENGKYKYFSLAYNVLTFTLFEIGDVSSKEIYSIDSTHFYFLTDEPGTVSLFDVSKNKIAETYLSPNNNMTSFFITKDNKVIGLNYGGIYLWDSLLSPEIKLNSSEWSMDNNFDLVLNASPVLDFNNNALIMSNVRWYNEPGDIHTFWVMKQEEKNQQYEIIGKYNLNSAIKLDDNEFALIEKNKENHFQIFNSNNLDQSTSFIFEPEIDTVKKLNGGGTIFYGQDRFCFIENLSDNKCQYNVQLENGKIDDLLLLTPFEFLTLDNSKGNPKLTRWDAKNKKKIEEFNFQRKDSFARYLTLSDSRKIFFTNYHLYFYDGSKKFKSAFTKVQYDHFAGVTTKKRITDKYFATCGFSFEDDGERRKSNEDELEVKVSSPCFRYGEKLQQEQHLGGYDFGPIKLSLWSFDSKKIVQDFEETTDIFLIENKGHEEIVTLSKDNKTLTYWDLVTGKELRKIKIELKSIERLIELKNSKLLVLDQAGFISLFNLENGKIEKQYFPQIFNYKKIDLDRIVLHVLINNEAFLMFSDSKIEYFKL